MDERFYLRGSGDQVRGGKAEFIRFGNVEHDYPVGAAGRQDLKFAVVDPSNAAVRGETWKLLAHPGKDDLYIFGRGWNDNHKFSLHESGEWRHQKPHIKQRVVPEDQYAIGGSKPLPEGRVMESCSGTFTDQPGWHEIFSIRTPRRTLRKQNLKAKAFKGCAAVPAPPAGHVSEVKVFMGTSNPAPLALTTDGEPYRSLWFLDGFFLPSGKVVVAIAGSYAPSRREQRWITALPRGADDDKPASLPVDRANRRRVMYVDDSAPFPIIYDLAPRAARNPD